MAEAAGSRAAASGQRTSATPSMPERQLRGKLDGRNGSDADRRPYRLNDNFVTAPDLAGETFQLHRLAGRLRLEEAARPLRSEGSSRPEAAPELTPDRTFGHP